MKLRKTSASVRGRSTSAADHGRCVEAIERRCNPAAGSFETTADDADDSEAQADQRRGQHHPVDGNRTVLVSGKVDDEIRFLHVVTPQAKRSVRVTGSWPFLGATKVKEDRMRAICGSRLLPTTPDRGEAGYAPAGQQY
jgi:hypothetical protein